MDCLVGLDKFSFTEENYITDKSIFANLCVYPNLPLSIFVKPHQAFLNIIVILYKKYLITIKFNK